MTDIDEWRSATRELTEADWLPYTDPRTYADVMAADRTRL